MKTILQYFELNKEAPQTRIQTLDQHVEFKKGNDEIIKKPNNLDQTENNLIDFQDICNQVLNMSGPDLRDMLNCLGLRTGGKKEDKIKQILNQDLKRLKRAIITHKDKKLENELFDDVQPANKKCKLTDNQSAVSIHTLQQSLGEIYDNSVTVPENSNFNIFTFSTNPENNIAIENKQTYKKSEIVNQEIMPKF